MLALLAQQFQDWQIRQAQQAIRLYFCYRRRAGSHADAPGEPPSATSASSGDSLEDSLIRLLRLKHLSYRTEKTYLSWVSRFGSFTGAKDCACLSKQDLKSFLSCLAVEKKVFAATQKQAFNALLKGEIRGLESVVPSRTPRRLPVVLTKEEIKEIFAGLGGSPLLLATVIYDGGLRLQECLSLRVKDVGFSRNCLVIRSGKGDKDRETVLPDRVIAGLKRHLTRVRGLYARAFTYAHPALTSLCSASASTWTIGSGYDRRLLS